MFFAKTRHASFFVWPAAVRPAVLSSAIVSSAPVGSARRNARSKARRRTAAVRHGGHGREPSRHSHAPRPGAVRLSTARPSAARAHANQRDLRSRVRHPTQVRCGWRIDITRRSTLPWLAALAVRLRRWRSRRRCWASRSLRHRPKRSLPRLHPRARRSLRSRPPARARRSPPTARRYHSLLGHHGAVGGVPLHLAACRLFGDPLALGVLDALVELVAPCRHPSGAGSRSGCRCAPR